MASCRPRAKQCGRDRGKQGQQVQQEQPCPPSPVVSCSLRAKQCVRDPRAVQGERREGQEGREDWRINLLAELLR